MEEFGKGIFKTNDTFKIEHKKDSFKLEINGTKIGRVKGYTVKHNADEVVSVTLDLLFMPECVDILIDTTSQVDLL